MCSKHIGEEHLAIDSPEGLTLRREQLGQILLFAGRLWSMPIRRYTHNGVHSRNFPPGSA